MTGRVAAKLSFQEIVAGWGILENELFSCDILGSGLPTICLSVID